MKMSGRVLRCCVVLFVALTSVSAAQKKLDSINDLKKINFSQSVSKHSLLLLFWFANTVDIDDNNVIQLTFDVDRGDYGSHHYGNYEGLLDSLPQGSVYRYFTVGNLNHDTSSVQLPHYVVHPFTEYVGRNRDRIIFRVREQNTGWGVVQRVDQVYMTQHIEHRMEYDPDHTYRITTNLLRQIREFSVGENQQPLSDLRSLFGSNADVSRIRNTWGDLASLGLLLFIVIQERFLHSQYNRPENRFQPANNHTPENNYTGANYKLKYSTLDKKHTKEKSSTLDKKLSLGKNSTLDKKLTQEKSATLDEKLTPGKISTLDEKLTPGKISTLDEKLTPGKISTLDKKLTPEKTSTLDKKPTPEKTSTLDKKPTPEKTSTLDKKPTPEKTYTLDKKPTPEKISTLDKKPTPEKISTLDKKPTPEKTYTVDKKTTPDWNQTLEKDSTLDKKPTPESNQKRPENNHSLKSDYSLENNHTPENNYRLKNNYRLEIKYSPENNYRLQNNYRLKYRQNDWDDSASVNFCLFIFVLICIFIHGCFTMLGK